MLEHIFGSKTRLKMLKIFFRDPLESYYVRELTRLVDAQINAVRRELEVLMKAGLVIEITDSEYKKKSGSKLRKYYTIQNESILYPELQALLIKDQTLGEQKFFESIKVKAGNLKLFLLTGRFTGDKRAPSDMLLVGDSVKESVVENLVKKYEKEFGGQINYTILSTREFQDRRHVMDKFLFSLFEAKNIKVVDKIGV
jgi:DNA-binding transcriptional ArsR family regulator